MQQDFHKHKDFCNFRRLRKHNAFSQPDRFTVWTVKSTALGHIWHQMSTLCGLTVNRLEEIGMKTSCRFTKESLAGNRLCGSVGGRCLCGQIIPQNNPQIAAATLAVAQLCVHHAQ